MKRDMDLFRKLLLTIEERPFSGQWTSVEVEGYNKQEVTYHAMLAEEAGFINATFLLADDFVVERLTYAGHEFLDAARSDTLWQKAKQMLLKNAGALTVEGLKLALSHLMESAAKGIAV